MLKFYHEYICFSSYNHKKIRRGAAFFAALLHPLHSIIPRFACGYDNHNMADAVAICGFIVSNFRL